MNTTRCATHFALLAATLVALSGMSARADEASAAKEKALIEVLSKDSPGAEKAIACKHLAVHGGKDAVPELAKLLTDEQLASWARIALEAIPDAAVDEALLKALDSLKGKLLVGTINSIGVRRGANATDALAGRLKDADAEVASAAAVALGRIGNPAATKALRESLAGAAAGVRSAVAEGCVLCAERLMADGKASEAAAIYDEVRKAEVPKQRVIEATRGAILARKSEGIPLLVELFKSSDKVLFQVGLGTARELGGPEVADALATALASTDPDRAVLLLETLADGSDAAVPAAVLQAAKTGPKQVRVAAVGVIGKLGNDSSVPTLLEIATDADAELADAAKTALAGLQGAQVDKEIASRLSKASGKMLPVLISLVGQRRIDATPALVKALDSSDAAVRSAALTALGETIGPADLKVLISQATSAKNSADAPVALQALRAACVRMPDREACAAELASAMPKASLATKSGLLEILGAMGGPKALDTISATVKGADPELQDAGSRILGEWMSVDAGPALLDLAKTAPSDKYQVRALRGYIRLARQFAMADKDRADMCQKALDASSRADEQKLVLAVLQRYPNVDTLRVAVKASKAPALKEEATRVILLMAQKLGGKTADVRDILAKVDMQPVKVEIVKAEYGAGDKQKDVTKDLQRQASDSPLIALSGETYSASFGGDPLPGTAKQLKVQYKINGKAGEATFAEDAVIMLPMPK